MSNPAGPPPPPISQLDHTQALRLSFDEANRAIRTQTTIQSVTVDPIDVYINDTIDSVKIGGGGPGPYLKINSDGSINTAAIGIANASIGANGAIAPTSSTEIGAIDQSGNLQGLKVDSLRQLLVNNTANTQPVSATALPLPTGAATSANQTTEINSLASIVTNTSSALSSPGGAIGSKIVAMGVQGSDLNIHPLQSDNNGNLLLSVVNNISTQQVGSQQIGSASALNVDAIPSTDFIYLRSASFQVTGTFVGVLSLQCSDDGFTTVSAAPFYSATAINGQSPITSTPSTGAFYFNSKQRQYRLRMTSYTSGTANVSWIQYSYSILADNITQPVNGSVSVSNFPATQTVIGTVTTNDQGAVTLAVPAYSAGTNAPLSLNLSGGLRVDGSATTQPVSGTIGVSSLPSIPAGTNAIGNVSVSNFPATQLVSGTIAVSSLPSIPAGTNAIGTVNVSNFPATQPVSGTVGVSSLPSIPTGTNAIGSVSVSNFPATQPISGTIAVSSLPSIPAGSNSIGTIILGAGAASVGSVSVSNFPVTQAVSGTVTANGQGAVTTSAPTYTAATNAQLSLNIAGGLRVDGSGITQPVSGTIAVSLLPSIPAGANAIGSVSVSNFPATQAISAVSLPLPTGAAQDSTVANVQGTVAAGSAALKSGLVGAVFNTALPVLTTGQQAALQADSSGRLLVGSIAGALPAGANAIGSVSVSNFPATQPVSGSVAVSNFPATQTVSGTVTANAGTGTFQTNVTNTSLTINQPTAANLNATVTGTVNANGQAFVTTAAPTYTAATNAPLSLNTSGGLRVDGSGVTQPVSGNVTANQGTANATPWNQNIAQYGGVAVSLGAKVAASSEPVALATDQLSTLATSANQTTELASLATITTNTSNTNTSVQALQVAQGSTTVSQKGMLIEAAATATAPSYTTATTNPLSLTLTGALRTDASATTQPVSGTVAVNNFPATQVISGTVASNSQGAVTTSAPTYTAATNAQLSLNTAGGLRVDGSGITQPVSGTVAVSSLPSIPAGANAIGTVNVSNFPATQPVSGTIAVSSLPSIPAGANAIGSVSVSNFPATQPVSGTVGVSSLPSIPAGSNSIGTIILGAGAASVGSVSVSNFPATQAVSGAVTANAGTGTFQTNVTNTSLTINQPTAANLNATVTGTVTANGQGAVTTSAPTYTAATNAQLSLTLGGGLRIDGSATTQPISGAVTANAGTGTFQTNVTNASLIVTQNTAANLNATVTGNVSVSNFPATQPVSGTVTSNQGTANATPWNQNITQYGGVAVSLGAKVAASSEPVALATDQLSTLATASNQTSGNTSLSTIASNSGNTQGSVSAGTAALKSDLIGVTYNTTLPTLTTSQQVAAQSDSSGRLLVGSIATPVVMTRPDSSTASSITATDAVVSAPAGDGTLRTGVSTAGSYVFLANPGGDSSFSAQIIGTLSGTYYFESSLDSTTGTDGNWISMNVRQIGILNTVLVGSTAISGYFKGNTSGAVYVRVRNVGGTAPNTQIKLEISSGIGAIFLNASLPSGTNTLGSINIAGSSGPANPPVRNVYSTTNVTTAAYVQLVAATTSVATKLEIFDSSGQTLTLAVGAAGVEVVQLNILPGGNGQISITIPAGSRVAVKALSSNAIIGELDINFYK